MIEAGAGNTVGTCTDCGETIGQAKEVLRQLGDLHIDTNARAEALRRAAQMFFSGLAWIPSDSLRTHIDPVYTFVEDTAFGNFCMLLISIRQSLLSYLI